MDQVYQGRHIHAVAELNLDTDCWIPTANVSWYEQGKVQYQRLTGANDHFKIIDDAQIYAVEMAKAWIDSALRFQSKTPTDLIAAASQTLAAGGYQQIPHRFREWDTPTSRLFEDEYNVVGIVVFDTCGELLRTWPDLQGSLVDVISQHVDQGESKSWDGYLVLLTPGFAPSEAVGIEAVRYNTNRLRKLVATGDDLRSPTDVERVLRPLLPLGQDRANLSQESALDLLPKVLAEQGIPKETTQLLVDAFREQSPLLERLHQQRGKQ